MDRPSIPISAKIIGPAVLYHVRCALTSVCLWPASGLAKAAAGIAADGRSYPTHATPLLRIFELRRGLQRLLGGVHRCQPFVVLGVMTNADRRRRYRDIVLADAEETTDR